MVDKIIGNRTTLLGDDLNSELRGGGLFNISFSDAVKAEAFVKCKRHCCICDKFCGTKIEAHHIKPQSKGGKDTLDNCIPLCFDCHQEVHQASNPRGNQYSEKELRNHRGNAFGKYIDSKLTKDTYNQTVMEFVFANDSTGKFVEPSRDLKAKLVAWFVTKDRKKSLFNVRIIDERIDDCKKELEKIDIVDEHAMYITVQNRITHFEERVENRAKAIELFMRNSIVHFLHIFDISKLLVVIKYIVEYQRLSFRDDEFRKKFDEFDFYIRQEVCKGVLQDYYFTVDLPKSEIDENEYPYGLDLLDFNDLCQTQYIVPGFCCHLVGIEANVKKESELKYLYDLLNYKAGLH